jgi:thiosulfate/3-mercaptopyruvate sulfurtransferase
VKKISTAVFLAIVSLAVVGCTSGPGTAPKGSEVAIEKAAIAYADDIKTGNYKIITTEALKKWSDEGKKMLIISTLTADDDKNIGRIPSAVGSMIPRTEKELTQADKDSLLKTAGIEKDRTIVVYCGFVACRRSHIGAKILVDEGFTNVYRYPGGMAAWKEMGYPVTK